MARVIRSNRRATVAQIAEAVNAGSDRKVSEYTVHHSLLRMGRRPVRVPILTPVHHQKCHQWARVHQNWTTEQWKKVAWSDGSRFLLHHTDGRVLPDGCGLFQQDKAPCHKAKMLQEWFDEHNNQFEVLTWPPNSPDLNPIQHLWDVPDKQDLKELLLTSWCQIPQHTFRDPV
ncbi:hypothetical protein QTP86_030370 [Hemibagrus guttatus]|nr:hypothetical protein QTP86_030370 [Hemibagrus guttatus]